MPKKNFKTLTIHESVYDKVRSYYQEINPRNLDNLQRIENKRLAGGLHWSGLIL